MLHFQVTRYSLTDIDNVKIFIRFLRVGVIQIEWDDEFNFEHCIRRRNGFRVEFERRCEEVERVYGQINLFSNSVAVEI